MILCGSKIAFPDWETRRLNLSTSKRHNFTKASIEERHGEHDSYKSRRPGIDNLSFKLQQVACFPLLPANHGASNVHQAMALHNRFCSITNAVEDCCFANIGGYRGILGLYRENGKENGNYYVL